MQIRLYDLQALPNFISLKASKSNNLAEAGFAINVMGHIKLGQKSGRINVYLIYELSGIYRNKTR